MTMPGGGAALDRARLPRVRGVPRVAALLVGLLVLSGCSLVSWFAPSDPWPPTYLVNRDGVILVGHRCSDGLMAVEVRWETDGGESHYPESWNASADWPGVDEMVLFGTQPGVRVTNDVRPPESFTGRLFVSTLEAGGYRGYETYVSGEILPGMVGFGGVLPEGSSLPFPTVTSAAERVAA